MPRPDCTICRHHAPTATGAQVECRHPAATLTRAMAFMAAAFGAPEGAETAEFEAGEGPGGPPIKVVFQLPAVLKEHATWPLSFDPQWIVECTGYQAVSTPENAE